MNEPDSTGALLARMMPSVWAATTTPAAEPQQEGGQDGFQQTTKDALDRLRDDIAEKKRQIREREEAIREERKQPTHEDELEILEMELRRFRAQLSELNRLLNLIRRVWNRIWPDKPFPGDPPEPPPHYDPIPGTHGKEYYVSATPAVSALQTLPGSADSIARIPSGSCHLNSGLV